MDGETIGTVFVRTDVDDLTTRIKGYATPLARVMLFSALVGLALASRLQRELARPVLRLSEAARAVAETRDYSVRVEESGPRELRTLTATFNAMLARIEEQDAALRSARDELEERVRERVRELQHQVREREQVQAALRSSEDRFRSIVETTRDWIWASDATGCSTYSNPAVERILGYAPAELLGRSLVDLVHPEDRPRALDLLRNCLSGGTGRTGLILRVQHRQGGYRDLEFAGVPILDARGRVRGFQGSGHDTTERRQLEEQLRQSQKMEAVGRLAGGVAHDFNNLLGVILGYSELLVKQHPDGPCRSKLEEVRRAAERAAALTRQLLAFSRKQVLDLRVVDLNLILADTATLLRRLIGEDIDMQIMTAPDLGRVRADPGQIQQVLMNLAVNARDAMPTGGRLLLRTANAEVGDNLAREHRGLAPGRYVTVTVADDGCGMRPEVLAHVFEPFFTTKETGKGTGLGLAAV
jgi:PAS domain S-box-containing protein